MKVRSILVRAAAILGGSVVALGALAMLIYVITPGLFGSLQHLLSSAISQSHDEYAENDYDPGILGQEYIYAAEGMGGSLTFTRFGGLINAEILTMNTETMRACTFEMGNLKAIGRGKYEWLDPDKSYEDKKLDMTATHQNSL